MGVTIAYLMAAVSTLALIVLWFVCAYRELSQKRNTVRRAQEELTLHQKGYAKKCGTDDELAARHMLVTSVRIFDQITASYNITFEKLFYRIPGILMGFKFYRRMR